MQSEKEKKIICGISHLTAPQRPEREHRLKNHIHAHTHPIKAIVSIIRNPNRQMKKKTIID